MRRGVLADLPYPAGCVSCGAPGWPWCAPCETRVEVLEPPWCLRCGRPLTVAASSCRDCPPGEVASLRAPFRFEGPVRDALLQLKFAGVRALAGPLGRAMFAAAGPGDLQVTWVPLSARRRATRGYDQAEALARAVAAASGRRPVRTLARAVDGGPQARRAREERLDALRGAFRPVGSVPGELILVDDVVTTGSTAAECARVLRRAGARRVHVLAAARTLSGPLPGR